MAKDDSEDMPDDWAGSDERRIEIPRDVDRVAPILYEWFGDKVSVSNEQDAWLYLVDEYAAQIEASGMPPEIADGLREMLDSNGRKRVRPTRRAVVYRHDWITVDGFRVGQL